MTQESPPIDAELAQAFVDWVYPGGYVQPPPPTLADVVRWLNEHGYRVAQMEQFATHCTHRGSVLLAPIPPNEEQECDTRLMVIRGEL